jgi:hypothetical protein
MIGTVGYEGNALVHYCHCGKWGSFGYDVSLREDKLGAWYCFEHNPGQSEGKTSRVVIRLSERWLARAIEVGMARRALAVERGDTHYGDVPKTGDADDDIVGAIGECATAARLRLPWNPTVGGGADVGGVIEVRARRYPGTGCDLAIRPKDRDDKPYVLAWVNADQSIEVVGWMYGRDGKNRGTWNEKKKVWFNPPPYRPLHELEALLPKLLAAVQS